MAASSIRRIGLGTTLQVRESTSTAQGSTVFITIGNIIEPPTGPDGTATDIDVSVITDGTFQVFRKGTVDPGSGTLTVLYDPEDASGRFLSDLYAADAYPMPQWKITLPAVEGSTAQVETFSAYVNGLSREMPKNDKIMRTISYKASGNPGYTTTT